MQITKEVNMQRALSASDMYQILALSLRLPTEQLASGLLDGTLAEDVCAIMNELDFSEQDIEKTKSNFLIIQKSMSDIEVLLTEIRREYTRLFTHPKEPVVQIYETLFLYNSEEDDARPSLFISPSALDAERCYKKAGLTMSSEVGEPADHMATEMEFMMYLYMQKGKALQENNNEEITRREEEIKEFEEIHLKKWAKDFFDLCVSSTRNDAYRVLGELGKIYMDRMLAS